ncbi:MAG: hypothetical protein ACTSQX_14345 [Candidatus Heimdallarchaeota archaeon]
MSGKKALILENNKTMDEIIISGSYWFKIEMAYGLSKLGYTTSLIQHPSYDNYSWIHSEKFSNLDRFEKINDTISKYDLVILLDDIPMKKKFTGLKNTKIVYWDIEGFPNAKKFFDNENIKRKDNDFQYYGVKFTSALDVLNRYQYHLEHQKLQFWNVDEYFSAAKNPLIINSNYLPLGAEPELYKLQNLIKRDISLSVIGSTSRWFQAKERLEIGNKMLEKINNPLAYWFGSMPENKELLPSNCFPMGHVDFLSLPNYLMRSKRVMHVPRPYHLDSECQSVTIFQAAAAGAIPIHHFKNNEEANTIGYYYDDILDLESLKSKIFPESYSYKSRFKDMIEILGGV